MGQLLGEPFESLGARPSGSEEAVIWRVPVEQHGNSGSRSEALRDLAAHRSGPDHEDAGGGAAHPAEKLLGGDGRD